MSAECDALKAQLQRIEQAIAALDGKYLKVAEKPVILGEADSNFRSAFPTLFGALFVGAFGKNILPYSLKLDDTSLTASLAKAAAKVADDKAKVADLAARAADLEAKGATALGNANRTAIKAVDEVAQAAKTVGNEAKGLAKGAAKVATKAIDDAGGAVKSALQANKVSAKALGVAGNALGKVLGVLAKLSIIFDLINIIFGILSTVVLARQLAALFNRLEVIERTLAPLYGLIGVNKSAIRRVEEKANAAYSKATNAENKAGTALGAANSAQSTASSALSTALNAVATVASLLYLRSLVPKIAAVASSAQATAQQALLTKARPGLQGAPGKEGARGAPGLPGLIGAPGRPGLIGPAGPAGERGRRGSPGFQGATGQPGTNGRNGLRGQPGSPGTKGKDGIMNDADRALLLKIDRTTTADAAVGQQTQTILKAQSGIIVGRLQAMQAFAELAWKNSRLGKVINLLTLASTLHNAAMLSRGVGDTIGELATNMFATAGIKDEKGAPLDINQLVGASTKAFIQSVVGVEVYTDVSTTWKKANRIISSASMMLSTIRGLHDTSKDVMEWTAENTGKIGNALRRYGVVGERAYPFMSERVKAQDAYRLKFQRVTDGLESLEDTASSLSTVTSNVREIQEEYTELKQQKTAFTALITTGDPATTPPASPENAPIAAVEATAKTAAESPPISSFTARKGVVE